MARSIYIFKSFEEQEQFHKELMKQTTVVERFKKLFAMQQLTKLLHPINNTERKIIIRNGHIE
jgi:hypothetical protein